MQLFGVQSSGHNGVERIKSSKERHQLRFFELMKVKRKNIKKPVGLKEGVGGMVRSLGIEGSVQFTHYYQSVKLFQSRKKEGIN